MPDIPTECSGLTELFPEYVHLACMRVPDTAPPVLDAEQPLIGKAVAKRRREFSSGRCCARQALSELGFTDTPILHDQNGAPLWPQGIVGSITHTTTYAAAAVAEGSRLHGLGIDMETISRVSSRIMDKILTATEKTALQSLPDPTKQQHLLSLYFSAKEAIYKCLHPLLQCLIGFKDARIEYEPVKDSINIFLAPRLQSMLPGENHLQGRYCYFDNTVCTAIWLTRPADAGP
jgi:4'-phosphopantetheinyl transferase EntD